MNTFKIIALIGFMLALAIGLFLFRGKEVELEPREIVSLERVVQMREADDFARGTSESDILVRAVPRIPQAVSRMKNRQYEREYSRIEVDYGQFFAAVGDGLSRDEIEEIKNQLVEINLDKLGMYSKEVGMNVDELTAYHEEIDEFDRKSGEEMESLMNKDVAKRFHRYRQTLPYRSYMEIVSKRMSSKGYRLDEETYENILHAIVDSKKQVRSYLSDLSFRHSESGSVTEEESTRILKKMKGDMNAILVNRLSRVLEPEGIDQFLEIYYSNSAVPLMSE